MPRLMGGKVLTDEGGKRGAIRNIRVYYRIYRINKSPLSKKIFV